MSGNNKIRKLCCPNCGKSGNMIKKNGLTSKGTQRYKCHCGKTFILPTDEEMPNCPNCKNNTNVIKWGEVKNKYGYIRDKQSRYYCKEHKITFSKKDRRFDEMAIIKAYILGGDIALREFVYDESGFNCATFNACMEILQEYRKMSKEEKELLNYSIKKRPSED